MLLAATKCPVSVRDGLLCRPLHPPGWGCDSGGAGGGWRGGHGGSAGREVWGRGVEGPQGLYVVQLARVSPPSEETKVAGAEQAVEGGRWEGDECPNASRARSGLLAPQLDGFGGENTFRSPANKTSRCCTSDITQPGHLVPADVSRSVQRPKWLRLG